MSDHKPKKPPLDERQQEAERILRNIERDSESVASSSAARGASGFLDQLSGRDGTVEDDDPIEVLGKRIGRTLGYAALGGLIVYLTVTYLL